MKSWLVPVENLHPNEQQAMYLLLNRHFKGMTWEGFQADLARKNWVLLLKDPDASVLKGFSTFLWQSTVFAGEPIGVVYSGDTIIDPSSWFSPAFPRDWIAAINYLRRSMPSSKLYWLLICSGFRTYRFLPTFWRRFYPCYAVPTPPQAAALIHALAQSYYGDCYQQDSGIVRFRYPQILQDNLIEIPDGRRANPHVAFFTAKNPHYQAGDELVCLTEICAENLTRAGERMWQSDSSLELG